MFHKKKKKRTVSKKNEKRKEVFKKKKYIFRLRRGEPRFWEKNNIYRRVASKKIII
jgi:hypothetical protein